MPLASMVRLSIIIPVLNEAEMIASAVDRAWELEPVDVIVADGGSTDRTAEIARSLRCVVVHSPRGRGRQQNAGADVATGEVLLFLHADTWLEPQAATQIDRAISNRRKICGAFRQHIDSDAPAYRLLERGNWLRAQLLGLPYGDQGIFVRRDAFISVGGFANVPLMEDVLLMRKLRERSMPTMLPGPLHVSPRRWQKYGIARQTMRNWLLLTAFQLGVPPQRLAPAYRPHSEPSGSA